MSLIEMSVTGAVMILFTVVIRALLIRRLPKRTFSVLWLIAAVRLMIPFYLPCEFSVYSLLPPREAEPDKAVNVVETENSHFVQFVSTHLPGNSAEIPVSDNHAAVLTVNPLTAVWLVGMLLLAAFFTVSYIKCMRRFRESLPVDNFFISQWLAKHKLLRTISVRYTDRISSPLTYGIFRPVILLPKNFEQFDADDLKFVLAHEYTHIRRFDTAYKLMLTAALCVHWFNPIVWLMFYLANRDIELSCDEDVLRMFGSGENQAYAIALIRMEESKSELIPLTNHFRKNAIKERIELIMKFKKASIPAITAAVCLITVSTTAFASTIANDSKPMDITENPSFVSAHVDADASVIRREGDMNIVYEDANFTLKSQDIPLVSDVNIDYGAPTLVSKNEYKDGDYRYVDEIYSYPVNFAARSLKKKHQEAVHTIYYEPDNTSSTRIAKMYIKADFYYDPEQNYAYCDEESVICSVEKTTNDQYPVYYEVYKNCQSGIAGDDYNYAQVVYSVQFYKTSSSYDTHRMVLSVKANGDAWMSCLH